MRCQRNSREVGKSQAVGRQSGQAGWRSWIGGSGWCLLFFLKKFESCCTSPLWLLSDILRFEDVIYSREKFLKVARAIVDDIGVEL